MRTKQAARRPAFSEPHICGCYFLHPDRKRIYLPQISLRSHSSINAQCFTTKLTQTFYNPNDEQIAQARYAFPLYDGVTVNGYTISYAGKVLKGLVKQKDEARTIYKAAIDRGETAGLLEALPAGVFGVSLGNVPPKVSIVVEITYCGELKHDAAIDGLRYTLPTSISPRYGEYPGSVLESNAVAQGGISITVDIDTAGASIRRVQSPSHPIAVSMGELSRTTEGGKEPAPYTPSQASATLSLGTAELDGDFVLQMVIDHIGDPQAIIESHPELSNQRAIMTTLVPKFKLKAESPEIVFVADQSGSMRGPMNEALKAALRVFLKSLPLGVRFNICAFGNNHSFLWPKSQAYNESNLDTAMAFVESFQAQYGGTKILEPITATFENRLGDLPLEVMLLTDGRIWNEEEVFKYINEQIFEKKVNSRMFALGIGTSVSHTLVEGVARAGNGFAQFVTEANEGHQSYDDLDQKIIRMLKAALFTHTYDYQLEVHYDDRDSMQDDEDFELVERVGDCLSLKDDDTIAGSPSPANSSDEKKPKSFFDQSTNLDEPMESSADRYAHLPIIETPKILQSPTMIPSLFPFNRTTVYLLLGPESSQQTVRSVTLRAKSAEGPLELDIPVKAIGNGCTIHQLAVRKAIQDLEEGRGWLSVATVGVSKDSAKDKFASRFDELVEREAVRIGEKFQVAGKWTSFIAVEKQGSEYVQGRSSPDIQLTAPEPRMQMASRKMIRAPSAYSPPEQGRVTQAQMYPPAPMGFGSPAGFRQRLAAPMSKSSGAVGGGLFGNSHSSDMGPLGTTGGGGGALFSTSSGAVTQSHGVQQSNSFLGEFAAALPHTSMQVDAFKSAVRFRSHMPVQTQRQDRVFQSMTGAGQSSESGETKVPSTPVETMRQVIRLQTFSGAWAWSPQLSQLLGITEASIDTSKFRAEADIAATILVIAFLQAKVAEQSGTWDLVVEKARTWLKNDRKMDEQEMAEMITAAKGYY